MNASPHGSVLIGATAAALRKAFPWLALALALGVPVPAAADVVRLEPERPVAGAGVVMTYDSTAEGAALGVSEKIFCVAWFYHADHGFERRVLAPLKADGGVTRWEVTIPADLAYMVLHFVTRHASDKQATIQTQIQRPDGVPVRTAWEVSSLYPFMQHDYLERISKERVLYPDNFAAYRTKWFVTSAYDKEAQIPMVRKDVSRLERRRDRSVDLLYALSYGYMVLKQEAKSREALHKMVDASPGAPLTFSALSDYAYQAYAQGIQGSGPAEVRELKLGLAVRFPSGTKVRDLAEGIAADAGFPLEALEAICRRWMEDEPENPLPYLHLATAYHKRGKSLDEAASLAEKSAGLMLGGALNLYQDGGKDIADMYLSSASRLAARLALETGHHARALAFARLAEGQKGELLPASYVIEAKAWEEIGEPEEAEASYLEALRRGGSKEAEDALRDLYRRRQGGLEGFDAYLIATLRRAGRDKGQGDAAPAFKGVGLDGMQFDSTALRGKVLVLNFWTIGCAPCRVEMPGLNNLARKYADRDVVFLAFTSDPRSTVESFLKENEFSYHVIPESHEVFESFGVEAFPTHVIIGTSGDVVTRLLGAREDPENELGRMIDVALAGP